jgi:hypothetical protein
MVLLGALKVRKAQFFRYTQTITFIYTQHMQTGVMLKFEENPKYPLTAMRPSTCLQQSCSQSSDKLDKDYQLHQVMQLISSEIWSHFYAHHQPDLVHGLHL